MDLQSDRLYLCGSHNGSNGAVALFRSKEQEIETRLKALSVGSKFEKWEVAEVDDKESEKKLLRKFKLNTLYTEETVA